MELDLTNLTNLTKIHNSQNISNNNDNNDNIELEFDDIYNIISQKINNMKLFDNMLIEQMLNGLKIYCQTHNKMLNDWFDENYTNDLISLKTTNKNFAELSNKFANNTFIIVKRNIN